jgi:hypothetical protein
MLDKFLSKFSEANGLQVKSCGNNIIIVSGPPGCGKGYLIKSQLLNMSLSDDNVFAFDIFGEYSSCLGMDNINIKDKTDIVENGFIKTLELICSKDTVSANDNPIYIIIDNLPDLLKLEQSPEKETDFIRLLEKAKGDDCFFVLCYQHPDNLPDIVRDFLLSA